MIAALAFPRGQAARAVGMAWERSRRLFIIAWIKAKVRRILDTKFHSQEVWNQVQPRFEMLADPPEEGIREGVEVLRDPFDTPIVAACVWHQLPLLITGDKDLVEDAMARMHT